MGKDTYRKRIPLVSLVADRENPRLPRPAESHRAALLQVIRVQGEKVVELVRDIVAMGGLNPGESLWVVEAESDPGTFVVLEGNRRYAALRLLQEPELAEAAGLAAAQRARLARVAGDFRAPPEVECTVFPERGGARPWILRKHTGERDGAGTVRWWTVQRARYEAAHTGVKEPGLDVLDFALDHRPDLGADQRLTLEERFSLSNLERLLFDAKAQARLGVEIRQGRLWTTLYGSRFLRVAGRLVDDVAHSLKVSDIEGEDEIRKYLDNFVERYVPTDAPRRERRLLSEVRADEVEPPAAGGSLGSGGAAPPAGVQNLGPRLPPASNSSGSLGSAPSGPTTASSSGTSATPPAAPSASPPTTPAKRSPPSVTPRPNRVYRRGLKLYIKHPRVAALLVELRDIDVVKFPNAAAALKRIMLDLSTEVFLLAAPHVAPRDKSGGPDTRLYKRVEAVVNHLHKKEGRLSDKEAEAILLATSWNYAEGSVRSMNLNVHNPNVMPTAQEVQNAWAVYEPLYRALWGLYQELT